MKLKNNISKLWPRVGALLIDFLVIGIFGLILGIVFEDYFVSIGNQGLFFGLIISIIYFSIANSKISGGQTIGKKVVKIKTINSLGNAVSIKTSLLRSLILVTPYFLINYQIPGVNELSALNVYKSAILISAFFGIIILYIANKSTRQSLHDLIMGTYVVKVKENEDGSELHPNSKVGIYIFSGLTIIIIGLSTYNLINKESVISDFENLNGQIREIDGVLRVGTSRNTTTFYGDEKSTTESFTLILNVQKIPNQSNFEESNIVKRALKILFKTKPEIKELDLINIELNRGFNIGIAKKYSSFSSRKSPKEWIEIIE